MNMTSQLTDRQIESIPALCRDLIDICSRAKVLNDAYLAERGLTWEQARAMNEDQREVLQADYSNWVKPHLSKNSFNNTH